MFNIFRRRTETRSIGLDALLALGGAPTAAGVSIGTDSAMRSPPVRCAVKIMGDTLASLTPHLYRRLPDGGRERATDHPLYPLLTDCANGWTPASEFRLVMQTALALHGNSFAWVGRDGAGQVIELIPLDSRTVSVEVDSATMEPRYVVTTSNGQRREYSRRDILHIRDVGSSLYKGDSPVQMGREAIGLGIVLEQHAAGLFGRGARPSGVLKYPKQLTDDLLVRLRKSFEGFYKGGDNAGRVAILEDGVTFEPHQLSSVDAQFLEMRKFQLQEIARIWRIPAHLMGDLERTTHNNAEEMGAQFLSYCLMPILKLWQDAIRITCLTPDERREYYVEFLVDDLARADLAARFTAYSQAINAGVLSPNEVRAMENRGPYEGGEVFTRPVNTAAVKDAAQ
ncbi:phage portal protein [Magnetospirillum sp. 15-1]|uniref:phage portal protein n=1 Tax=Magnetospirillum sp. 15-1 TaxID=1979370 RepID=UPI000BBC6122|nr:phage portal protein [Magnetospirillum sp. 15-1]